MSTRIFILAAGACCLAIATTGLVASCELFESCRHKGDGYCDEDTGLCPVGTDTADCSEPKGTPTVRSV